MSNETNKNKIADIDEFLKTLSYLPRISGVFNATVDDFAKRHKIYRKRFFKKRIRDFQRRFNDALEVFDIYLQRLIDDLSQENKEENKKEESPKSENKFVAFFKNLVRPKKKDKQAAKDVVSDPVLKEDIKPQNETLQPTTSAEEIPEDATAKPKTNKTTKPSGSSTESQNGATAKPKTNKKTKVANTDKKE